MFSQPLKVNSLSVRACLLEQLIQLRSMSVAPKPPPKLVVIETQKKDDAKSYFKSLSKIMKKLDINVELHDLTNQNQSRVLERIYKLNCDSTVTGIIVLNPLASNLLPHLIQDSICATKDVDCQSDANLRILGQHLEMAPFVPPACRAVLYYFDKKGFHVKDRSMTIVGSSKHLGLPLKRLFSARGARIQSFDIRNKKE